jgi:hypothetical protein
VRPPGLTVSGPGFFGHVGAFARRAIIFFFAVTTVSSGFLALGRPLQQAFVIGLACGIVVALLTFLTTIVHLLELIPYETGLLDRVGSTLGARWGEEPLVTWTATLLPARRGGGLYVGREVVFVSHERRWAVALPDDVLFRAPLSDVVAVETGEPRSLREWLRAGSQTVEIILRNGEVIRLGVISPGSLVSALRDALRERGREGAREGNDRERGRERERERTG